MTTQTVDELLARLGNSDAAARQLVDLGPAVLPRLDALAVDPTVSKHARQAASLVADHIRCRALTAPAVPPARALPDGDARAYFAAGGVLKGDGFQAGHDPAAFVDALFAAGAVNVVVRDHDSLVVTLPAAADARARLIAIYNHEVERYGEDFGGEEPAGHEMTLEEATERGTPELAGEWVVDTLEVADTGQPTLTFWWD